MRGHEQMNAPQSREGAESLGLPIDSPEVQAALMLAVYRDELKKYDAYESREINISDPEKNSLEVQAAAGEAWIEPSSDLGDSFASSFRKYVEMHSYKHVHIEDEDEIRELIAALLPAGQGKLS